ncbi:MAG TPA: ABC transporter permease [Terriglobales bacterium]|nr:ABC transporter permease [Terriglobales bacterium]
MKARLTTLRQCQMILRMASWIVPRQVRTEWRREWEAELAFAWKTAQAKGSSSVLARLRWRCSGAFLDAAWYRWNREDLRHRGEYWSQTPTFVLSALLGVLLLLAGASGAFPRMRSILLRPPYADPQRVVTVSRTGGISSAEWVVPYLWVDLWRRHEQALEGVAAYSWSPRRTTIRIRGRQADVVSLRVEDGLFQVFGVEPLLGQTSRPSDAQDSRICLLLSYETWRRKFSRDPDILERNATLDGQPAIVIGVLPERFWFPSADVGVWRLEDKSSFSKELVGVVARLRPQVSERWVEWVLQRDISNMTGEAFTDSSVEVWPLQERIEQPLISYAVALSIALLVMMAVTWSGRFNLYPRRSWRLGACRWWTFFATKSFLLLLILLAAVVEFTPEPYVFPTGRTTFVMESVSLWVFSVGCMFMLWWSLKDQQSRCRVCLRRLVLPAHVGHYGYLLLGWVGTELACPEGHGLLHMTETDVCWLDPAQWTQLDESWESLFSERSKEEVLG